jgi:hypothetical protein
VVISRSPFRIYGNIWKPSAAIANPNPSPSTRFGPGNPSRGRQRAARDKISTEFLEALNVAFNEPNDSGGIKGLDAIKKVRDEDPATFAGIYATLLPKQFKIEDTSPEGALSNEQLETVYQALLADRTAAGINDKDQLAPGPQTVN